MRNEGITCQTCSLIITGYYTWYSLRSSHCGARHPIRRPMVSRLYHRFTYELCWRNYLYQSKFGCSGHLEVTAIRGSTHCYVFLLRFSAPVLLITATDGADVPTQCLHCEKFFASLSVFVVIHYLWN